MLVILVNLLHQLEDRQAVASDLLRRGVIGKVLQLTAPCHSDSAKAILRRLLLTLLATLTGLDWEPVAMLLPGSLSL